MFLFVFLPRSRGGPLSTCCPGQQLRCHNCTTERECCGLFAIGTAFQAASGLSCELQQEELRQHLNETLLCKTLHTIPGSEWGESLLTGHIVLTIVANYCTCCCVRSWV